MADFQTLQKQADVQATKEETDARTVKADATVALQVAQEAYKKKGVKLDRDMTTAYDEMKREIQERTESQFLNETGRYDELKSRRYSDLTVMDQSFRSLAGDLVPSISALQMAAQNEVNDTFTDLILPIEEDVGTIDDRLKDVRASLAISQLGPEAREIDDLERRTNQAMAALWSDGQTVSEDAERVEADGLRNLTTAKADQYSEFTELLLQASVAVKDLLDHWKGKDVELIREQNADLQDAKDDLATDKALYREDMRYLRKDTQKSEEALNDFQQAVRDETARIAGEVNGTLTEQVQAYKDCGEKAANATASVINVTFNEAKENSLKHIQAEGTRIMEAAGKQGEEVLKEIQAESQRGQATYGEFEREMSDLSASVVNQSISTQGRAEDARTDLEKAETALEQKAGQIKADAEGTEALLVGVTEHNAAKQEEIGSTIAHDFVEEEQAVASFVVGLMHEKQKSRTGATAMLLPLLWTESGAPQTTLNISG
jgi:hypothetical protein